MGQASGPGKPTCDYVHDPEDIVVSERGMLACEELHGPSALKVDSKERWRALQAILLMEQHGLSTLLRLDTDTEKIRRTNGANLRSSTL